MPDSVRPAVPSAFCLTGASCYCRGHGRPMKARQRGHSSLCILSTCQADFISRFCTCRCGDFLALRNNRIRFINLQPLIHLDCRSRPSGHHPGTHLATPLKGPLTHVSSLNLLHSWQRAKKPALIEKGQMPALCLFTRVIFHQRADVS